MFGPLIHNCGDSDRQSVLQDRLEAANKRIKDLEALVRHERGQRIAAEDRLICLGHLADMSDPASRI